MRSRPSRAESVFLNVPFDRGYERLFVALVAGLCVLGRRPRCVLEIPPTTDRLSRLLRIVRECRVSIHDLSRVGGYPPRFNMPFELGLAAAVSLSDHRRHQFFVLERKSYRLQRTLSDMNGYDPFLHGGTASGIVTALMSCVATRPATQRWVVEAAVRRLWRLAPALKRRHRERSVFARPVFDDLIVAATEIARSAGARAGRR